MLDQDLAARFDVVPRHFIVDTKTDRILMWKLMFDLNISCNRSQLISVIGNESKIPNGKVTDISGAELLFDFFQQHHINREVIAVASHINIKIEGP